jgi:hypothetical protein
LKYSEKFYLQKAQTALSKAEKLVNEEGMVNAD